MSHDHNAGASHGSIKQYTIGFILSIILTILPFGMAMSGGFSKSTLLAVVGLAGIVQIFVQLVFFLHMNASEEQRWNVIAFLYTILTIAILLIGSVWVMNYLHFNMML